MLSAVKKARMQSELYPSTNRGRQKTEEGAIPQRWKEYNLLEYPVSGFFSLDKISGSVLDI